MEAAPRATGDWEERRADIRRRFERIVRRYDIANTLLSLGRDERWRREAVRRGLRAAGLRSQGGRLVTTPGDPGLWVDLASGTGAMARALSRRGVERIVRLDLSALLLSDEHRLPGTLRGFRVVAESHRIPLAQGVAGGMVMGFATRHLPALDPFLREAARVLEPRGVLVLLDMGLGRGRIWAPFYRFYFRRILPLAAHLVTGHGETYRWMVRTVEEGPRPEAIAPALVAAGFERVEVHHMTGGAAYCVVAVR